MFLFTKGSGSYLRSLLPTSLFEHLSMGQDKHRHRKTTLNEVRALTAPLGRKAIACVSSPRDWAVSMGSHMQQDTVISFGATTSGRTFFHFFGPFSTKSGEKNAITSPGTLLSSVCFNACFTPRRAEQCLNNNCLRWYGGLFQDDRNSLGKGRPLCNCKRDYFPKKKRLPVFFFNRGASTT